MNTIPGDSVAQVNYFTSTEREFKGLYSQLIFPKVLQHRVQTLAIAFNSIRRDDNIVEITQAGLICQAS